MPSGMLRLTTSANSLASKPFAGATVAPQIAASTKGRRYRARTSMGERCQLTAAPVGAAMDMAAEGRSDGKLKTAGLAAGLLNAGLPNIAGKPGHVARRQGLLLRLFDHGH